MQESIEILASHPDALPSDKILVQHVKLAHIGEEISTQFCLDDPSAKFSVSEPKINYALKCFENTLQTVKEEDEKLPKDGE